MRDERIFAMQQANARRNALLFKQWEFLQTRQTAMEIVLVGRSNQTAEGKPQRGIEPAGFIRRIGWLINPARLVADVDAVQKLLLAEGQEKAEQAAGRKALTVVEGGQVKEISVNGNGSSHG